MAMKKLPSRFVKRCGDHVPEHITVQLPNGYLYYCRFNKEGNKFENIGLFFQDFKNNEGVYALVYCRGSGIFTIFILDHNGMEIDYPSKKKVDSGPCLFERAVVNKKYLKAGDTLLFQLISKNEFVVSIFSRKRVERTFPISTGTDDPVIRTIHQNYNNRVFDVVLIRSNLDQNSHGVYIPPWIIPEDQEWVNINKVCLIMNRRSWKFRVVCIHSKPRFSGGWDKFMNESKLSVHDKLRFKMIQEDDVISFNVSVI
ncbi:uncharacterized protein LOC141701568 [Apium graveolens]|uniref:uncharacterized protein LOC141701568 n=1 Tax=Apium graveolens TaxID=4045 RepID=UPI003D7B3C7B